MHCSGLLRHVARRKNKDYSYCVVEEVEYENKWELHNRERYYIENFECVNKNIPTRTRKEYDQDNKEKIKSLVPLNRINAYPHIRTKLGDDKLKLVLDDGRYWYNKDDIPDDVMNDIKLNLS